MPQNHEGMPAAGMPRQGMSTTGMVMAGVGMACLAFFCPMAVAIPLLIGSGIFGTLLLGRIPGVKSGINSLFENKTAQREVLPPEEEKSLRQSQQQSNEQTLEPLQTPLPPPTHSPQRRETSNGSISEVVTGARASDYEPLPQRRAMREDTTPALSRSNSARSTLISEEIARHERGPAAEEPERAVSRQSTARIR